MSLELEIIAPDRVITHGRVVSLQAADATGQFGIGPATRDFLTVLVPCVLRYRAEDGRESFAAVDGGVLLLENGRISVATRDAVVAERLDEVADGLPRCSLPARTRSKRLGQVSPSWRRPCCASCAKAGQP